MIGIYGGTFDPVHFGHLRAALEVYQGLKLREMRLIPCHLPPHREPPVADARARLTMLRAAVGDDTEGFVVDNREMRREGVSYMVDTLASLRTEWGDEPMCLVLGADAFLQLHHWHRWEEILLLTHLIVTHRPGWTLAADVPDLDPTLARLWREARVDDAAELAAAPAGRILQFTITQLDISATCIRAMVARGESPRFLLPEKVWNLIRMQGLYDIRGTSEEMPPQREK
jgi:nicotinate-nucleotide adenylyltransferase